MQLLFHSAASKHPQPEFVNGCGLRPSLEETQIAVMVQEGNYLSEYGDNDVDNFSCKHIPEGATILEAAFAHSFPKHPVGMRLCILSLSQHPVDVVHQNSVERVRI